MSETTAGLDMALWAIARGAKIIPAYIDKNCEKRPLLRNWQNEGSNDEEVIRRHWEIRPWANAGVIGGRDSWAVFDCDGAQAVSEFRAICSNIGGIDWTKVLVYRTPGRKEADGTGGGLHAMWRYPDWLGELHKAEIREPGWVGGIEFRAKATWTLLPCARKDGEYEIINAPDELDELPRELWLAFLERAEQQVIGDGGSGNLREVSPEDAFAAVWTDNRKQCVAGLAWHCGLRGWDREDVMDICMKFAKEQCEPELDEGVVRHKVNYTMDRIERLREKQERELSVMRKWVDSI